MGTLGQFLRAAREKRGIDLRDAAQQTRISMVFLKALEEEDFAKLPGAVFVKGFLKNYGKFLLLDEQEVIKKYTELIAPQNAPGVVATKDPIITGNEQVRSQRSVVELFLWGSGVLIVCIVVLFMALPELRSRETREKTHEAVKPVFTVQTVTAPAPVSKPDKLYLEVIALDNTWLLVRTDNSPQKKAMLKKGESLIWSAEERFLLSYGSVKALTLKLNGQDLVVNEPGDSAVRDLTILASGIVSRKIQNESVKPAVRKRRKPSADRQPAPAVESGRVQHATPTEAPVREQQVSPPPVHPQESQASPASPVQSDAPSQEEKPQQETIPR